MDLIHGKDQGLGVSRCELLFFKGLNVLTGGKLKWINHTISQIEEGLKSQKNKRVY